MAEILLLPLKVSHAFLVVGERAILVDSGMKDDLPALLRGLRKAGVMPGDLSLVLHTHAHMDHAGCTAALCRDYAVPAAAHVGDVPYLEQGINVPLPEHRGWFRLVSSFMPHSYPAFHPDVIAEGDLELRPYGIPGRALHTPGHTPGSLTVMVDGVGAIAGDLMAGGNLFGAISPTRPNFHPIIQDRALLYASIRRVLAQNPPILYLGHGGPLDGAATQRWFAQQPEPN